MKRIILASSSPRRRELLAELLGKRGFRVVPSGFSEDNGHTDDPLGLAIRNAQGKARDVVGQIHEGIVIGVDTFVYMDGKVLGKPVDAKDAKRMLMAQSGKAVRVISGLCVIDSGTGKEITGSEETLVWIKKLSDEEIDSYNATGEGLDKAGSFGVQGKGALFVERIEGDYFNVVGLPLFRLDAMLRQVGFIILGQDSKVRITSNR